MKKEVFDLIKKESAYIGILFLLVIIIFKIAFFNEDLFVLTRTVFSIFWLFILPGYFIMLNWPELDFIERFIIGIAISAGITGVISYYLGLFGLNIKYHVILLPLAIIIIGFIILMKKK